MRKGVAFSLSPDAHIKLSLYKKVLFHLEHFKPVFSQCWSNTCNMNWLWQHTSGLELSSVLMDQKLLQCKCVIPHPQQAKVRNWLKLFFHVFLCQTQGFCLPISEKVAQFGGGKGQQSLLLRWKRNKNLSVIYCVIQPSQSGRDEHRWAVTAVDPWWSHCHSRECTLLISSFTISQLKLRCLPAARLVFHGTVIFSTFLAVSVNYLLCSLFLRPSAGKSCLCEM